MNAKTVELHLLQSFPPSCLNRDGNNSPKDCTFGDARRARISSQCLKRAIRQAESFAQTVGEEIATRSKQMRDKKLVPYLTKTKSLNQQDAEKVADEFRRLLASDDKKGTSTSVGLYFGDAELYSLLDAFRAGDKKWKEKGRKSADVALFGRMLAEATDLGVDAAAQVAHAISTHKLSQEMDYWTAADDLKKRSEGEDAGAGMLGTAEFNASVFYRYACVSLPVLQGNLGDESMTKKTVEGFLRASFDAHREAEWPRAIHPAFLRPGGRKEEGHATEPQQRFPRSRALDKWQGAWIHICRSHAGAPQANARHGSSG